MPDEIQTTGSLNIPIPPPHTERPRSGLFRIFVGPRGVRAGWKVFIFFLIFAALGFCFRPIIKLAGPLNPKAPLSPGLALLNEVLGMIAVLIATAIMARWIDRKPWGYFGMPQRKALRSSFWVGAVVGFGALTLQLELMHLGGWFDFGTVQLQGVDIIKYGFVWALVFFCVGITEEGLLRGYVMRVTTDGFSMLRNGWSFWTSALLFSVIFGAGHLGNPGENKLGILMVFVDGMAMCFSLWRTGDLWWAIGNHAAWDWGETFFFGTPNSGFHGQHPLMNPSFHGPLLFAGGSDGPEGSILALLSEALLIISVAIIYRRRKFRLINDDAPAEIP